MTLAILAVSGCLSLVLTQVGEVLSKLPEIIRAWRQVRRELSGGTVPDGLERSPVISARDTPTTGLVADRESDEADARERRRVSGA